jgi:SAM-dependent methyltransferase
MLVDADRAAQRRRSFDRDPDAYLRARPPYPERVYEILGAECGLRPGCRILEIGPGAGQATGELLARGADVVAVEPGPGLADLLTRRLGNESLTVVVNDFEHADFPPGPYDLVVAATSFHWLDTATALPRVAALLAPGGWLVVWWTVFGDPERPTAFRAALDELYRRHLSDEWRPANGTNIRGPLRIESWTAELERGGWFGPVDVELIRWSHQLTPDSARRLWESFPNVNELDSDRRMAFLDAIASTIDEFGGTVTDPYVTAVYRTQPRLGPTPD